MVAVVSTFPPCPDGIAVYAAQMVRALRDQGTAIRSVGLIGSDADVVVDAGGGLRPLRLLNHCRYADRVLLHWHDQFFYQGGARNRLLTDVAFRLLFQRCPQIEIICHEAYPTLAPRADWGRRVLGALEARARKAVWRSAPRVVFHSEAERRATEAAIGVALEDRRVEIRPHGLFFSKFRDISQGEARRELGMPMEGVVFLCIGFLGASKGFHVALSAFRRLHNPDARLYIVGSPLYDTEEGRGYVRGLHEAAAGLPNATVIEAYLPDAEFDTWIAASDYVLAPYARAFSSSVVERAKLFGKVVVASGAGGLPHQLSGDDFVFSSEEELVSLMDRLDGRPAAAAC